ncbi:MAG TPA: phosphatase PAP2 family protein [Acidimicrobiales bacterium]|nr:phosphatase PAP2 family protein [Acidimicrobiales bacterium]
MGDATATGTSDTGATDAGAPSAIRERLGLRWWRELLYVAAFYFVYSFIRNRFGSASVGIEHAFHNAQTVIAIERAVGLYHEEGIQDLFIGNRLFMQFWNVFYGTFHFAVTIFAMVFTYRRFPARYPLWRNTLAFTTGLALIGFALFPLMPPRLLDSCGPYGACARYGFVDSLAQFGGLWSFDSGAMSKVSNQFAAMPSLHFAWSMWCFLVLYRNVRSPVAKVLVAAYPWLTLFAIMVTANHYWLDAVGGAVILAVGYVLGSLLTRWNDRRREQRRADVALVDDPRPV